MNFHLLFTVSQIRGNTLLATEAAGALAAAAAARATEHRAADVRVRPSVTQLKDMIARAKHAADSVSLFIYAYYCNPRKG